MASLPDIGDSPANPQYPVISEHFRRYPLTQPFSHPGDALTRFIIRAPVLVLGVAALALVIPAASPGPKWGVVHLYVWLIRHHAYWCAGLVAAATLPLYCVLFLRWGDVRMWASLGAGCVTRKCRMFSAPREHLPELLVQNWPGILSWYRAFWRADGNLALEWGLWFMNWVLTGSVVLLLAALIPGLPRKTLLDSAVWALSAGAFPLVLYFLLAQPFRKRWAAHQKDAATYLNGAPGSWNSAVSACGADASPYWGLLTEFVVLPFSWLGLPLGYAVNVWAILFVAIMALGLSLHLAALRFWLFCPGADETPYLCCNLPLREFHVALTGEPGFLDYVRKLLHSCKI